MIAPFLPRHLLAVVALAAQQPAPDLRMAVPAPHRPDTAALARDIPGLLGTADIPSLSMAVVEGGRIVWTHAFGTAIDTATVFEAASMGKPVFAYVVLRLAERKEFDLDRPLYQMVEYPRLAHDARYKLITGRMALSHTTGLPNWGGERLTLAFTPGTAYGYSGEGFVFLQKALERFTGQPLEALARREVFEPLGMSSSSFVWQDRFAGHEAYARDWLRRVAPVNHYADGNAAYTLLTTAPDYARFVAAVLTRRGLSPATWKEYLTPLRQTAPGIYMALGIRVEEGQAGRIFYHSGSNGRRFTGYMTGDVGKGLGFVYFTGADNGTSLVEPLATRVLGRPPAHNWPLYDRYDDPRLGAIRSVERAAVEGGMDSARARLQAIGADPATRPSLEATLGLGSFFAARGMGPLAVEVLQGAVAKAPDSADTHLALGRAYEWAGDLDLGLESYRRARALEGPGGEAERHIQWAEQRRAARARPVSIPERTLESYAGQYQERSIVLRGGRLYYRRGASAETPLIPMTVDLLEVEENPMLRVRFVGDGTSPATSLVEIASDGTSDESARSK
jgi:CubicO group peptidase (beta-lactamase class C family)